jgi:hypothetical protein
VNLIRVGRRRIPIREKRRVTYLQEATLRRRAAIRGAVKRLMGGAVPCKPMIFAQLSEGNLSTRRGIPQGGYIPAANPNRRHMGTRKP